MSIKNLHRVIFFVLLYVIAIGSTQLAVGQESNQSPRPSAETRREDETNLDTELYLILASNQRTGEAQLPASLDQVVKQLRATLPFKNYSLAATLVNRLKSNGSLNLSWVGGPLLAPSTSVANMPSFNEFSIGRLRAVDGDGGPMVEMLRFSFGARIPIQTGTNIAQSGTTSAPVIIYEHTGLTTDISVRADQPAVVGTLNVGPSGEAIVVVISARRTAK